LLHTIDEEADRLNSLVENLLDMSRIQTGSVDVLTATTEVSDLVEAAVASLGPRGEAVTVELPEGLPRILTDPVLLERAVANLIDNALIHAGGVGLRVEAGTVAGRMDIRVIDRGPGIRRQDRDLVFRPFQRLGDSENLVGVGLGLAVARGFVEAVGGELDAEDTPGGGCTMVIRLPGVDAGPTTDGSLDDSHGSNGAGPPYPSPGPTGTGEPSTTAP
jgi:two-component system sensor histidine kinase KdpD